ncbi:MAG: antirepressor regulating drug resistance protein [Novosphingobium sp.]|uniref:M56 family metallopeptidase n=1 Tax=Novosphingobium sp. TaxID=1874826 RepID=UPI0012D20F9D|nr:M56 family metallopeptidase [Novosphingobium sp.]MPS67053.1 antirepressor regulating drug resistance protein [Novosphingobium sp.]
MIEWLTDTLVMTGALMALVLLVRRPVSRWFGPAAAYALWALPVLRLVLPPLALPRGLFTRPDIVVEQTTANALPAVDAALANATAPIAGPVADAGASVPVAAIEPGVLAQIPWGNLAIAIWLAGAVIFLVLRVRNYRLMKQELLADARQVARAGDIRIVETPAAGAPLAFGVTDRVVALPRGFLATVDSESSDFAIAHELEHHAGNDLLALMVLQPLFALHWFNPLGWAAWRALRADQEAACDARVMSGCNREMRARYGRVIASFAAGTRLTLAAPIAGTLAGEKPIIQRLKALASAEVSPARRVVARSLFAFAIVSVPCTATVTYAAMEEPEAPPAPEMPAAEPAAPRAPVVPDAPAEPQAASAVEHGTWTSEPAEISEAAEPLPSAASPRPVAAPWPSAQAVRSAPPVPPAPPAPPPPPSWQAAADRALARADHDAAMARAMRRVPKVEQSTSSDGRIQTIRIVSTDESGKRDVSNTMTLDSTCPADTHRSSAHARNGNRSTSVLICTGAPKHTAEVSLKAIASARATIAANRNLDSMVRSQILAELDKEMADTRRAALNEEGI